MSMAGFEDDTGLPDIALERYRLGELSPDAMQRIKGALERSDRLRARLEAIAAADAAVRQAYPPEDLARAVRRRTSAPVSNRARLRWLVPAGALAAMLVAVLINDAWIRSAGVMPGMASSHDEERVKGLEAALFVFRSTDGGGQPLADADLAHAGDVVRLGYRVTDPGFGLIVSVDGRGVLTRHLPGEGTHAAALAPGSTVLLDEAFELDDAPRVERFYLVSAREPFEVGPVVDAIRSATADATGAPAPLRLPDSLTTTTFSLRKD